MDPALHVTRRQTLKALFAFALSPKLALEAAAKPTSAQITSSPHSVRLASEIARTLNWFSHPTAGFRDSGSSASKAINAASMIERFSPNYFPDKLGTGTPIAKNALSGSIDPITETKLASVDRAAKAFKQAVPELKRLTNASSKSGAMLNEWLDALSEGRVESVIDHPCRKALVKYLRYLQGEAKLTQKEIEEIKKIFKEYDLDLSDQDDKFDGFYRKDASDFYSNVCWIRFFLDNDRGCNPIPKKLIAAISFNSRITDLFAEVEDANLPADRVAKSRIVEAILKEIPNFREIVKEAKGYVESNKQSIDWQNFWQAALVLPRVA